MEGYITKDRAMDLIIAASQGHPSRRANLLSKLEDEPAADVVEVVRCKDCVHFYPFVNNPKFGECMVYVCDLEDPAIMEETGFCSDGERKDDQQCK